VFCIIFFAGPNALEAAWANIITWKREFIDWLALCNHVSFMELPRGLDMTDDELLEYAEKRRQRKAELARLYEQRAKAKDLRGFLARRLRDKLRWTRLNPERASEIAFGVRARAKASAKHRCSTCDVNLASITALRKHLNTKAHKEQVRLSRVGRAKRLCEVGIGGI
jgi:ribosomal protein L34E